MKKNKYHKKRIEILKEEKHLIFDGWNENIFKSIANNSTFNEKEIKKIFLGDYKSLLKFYLSTSDEEMIKECNKLRLNNLKTNEKINKIILQRLKINEKEKELIKRTFFTLMLTQNANLLLSSLYSTVNNIWNITEDKSIDLNYYTKRAILARLYSRTFLLDQWK